MLRFAYTDDIMYAMTSTQPSDSSTTSASGATEPSPATLSRWALAELATPTGFVLGDVVAGVVLESGWLAGVIAEAKADALREAADDLGDTMIDTFWGAVAWLSARAASAESEAGQ